MAGTAFAGGIVDRNDIRCVFGFGYQRARLGRIVLGSLVDPVPDDGLFIVGKVDHTAAGVGSAIHPARKRGLLWSGSHRVRWYRRGRTEGRVVPWPLLWRQPQAPPVTIGTTSPRNDTVGRWRCLVYCCRRRHRPGGARCNCCRVSCSQTLRLALGTGLLFDNGSGFSVFEYAIACCSIFPNSGYVGIGKIPGFDQGNFEAFRPPSPWPCRPAGWWRKHRYRVSQYNGRVNLLIS